MPSDSSVQFRPTLAILLATGILGILGVIGCRSGGGNETAKVVVQSPLIGSEKVGDLASLHDSVAARASRGDTLGLLKLMVNDSVYRAVVWPSTPSYEPEREEVWDFVMAMHKSNSNKGLRRLIHDIAQPEAGAVIRLPLVPVPVRGGILHELAKTSKTESGVVVFASALCLENVGCQVLSYAQGGQRGAGVAEETGN
jgi:hypothetical protein